MRLIRRRHGGRSGAVATRVLSFLATGTAFGPPLACAGAGELDATFADRGRARVVGDATADDQGAALLVQPDGRIVVAGRSFGSGRGDLVIARLEPDGSPDLAFGAAGRVTIDVAGEADEATGLALQPDGKLVVAGRAGIAGGAALVVVRLDRDGTPDSGFDGDGRATRTLLRGVAGPVHVQVASDARIVVAAGASGSNDTDVAVVRFEANGAPDASFGDGGALVVDVGRQDVPSALLRRRDGGYVVCGTSSGGWDPDGTMFAVRFGPDGRVDRAFGVDGVWLRTRDAPGAFSNAQSCALLPDGVLVLAGTDDVVRVTPDGALDTSVWNGGATRIARAEGRWFPFAVAALADGRIAVAGSHVPAVLRDRSPGDMFVAVLDAQSGLLDAGFADGGLALVDVRDGAGFATSSAHALAQQVDGALLALGAGYGDAPFVALARLQLTGSRNEGIVAIVEPPETYSESAGEAMVHVRRSGGAAGAVEVAYRTEPITAADRADFTPASGTLRWEEGELGTKSIAIGIVSDAVREAPEQLRIAFASASAALVQREYVLTIADVEPAAATPSPPASGSSGGGGAAGGSLLAALLALPLLRRARCVQKRQPAPISQRVGSPGLDCRNTCSK